MNVCLFYKENPFWSILILLITSFVYPQYINSAIAGTPLHSDIIKRSYVFTAMISVGLPIYLISPKIAQKAYPFPYNPFFSKNTHLNTPTMPELPEVETTLRGIAPHILNQTISAVTVRQPKLRWQIPSALPETLRGLVVRECRRRAKYLLIRFDTGVLLVHLGMSGSK